MPIQLKPPKPPSNRSSSSPQPSSSTPASASATPPSQGSFTFSAPPPPSIPQNPFANTGYQAPPEPVAPAYSPITPKVLPAFPVIAPSQNGANNVVPPEANGRQMAATAQLGQPAPEPAIAPATYIPQPPPQPFSSEDSTDAIALRAAISALQFQKQKAQKDLHTLEAKKKQAVQQPEHFKDALVAGKLKEERPHFGGVQAILDAAESDSDDDEAVSEKVAEETEMADAEEAGISEQPQPGARPPEVPDSQPSRPTTSESMQPPPKPEAKPPDFSKLPGPQNVVRMPHVNWEKYHIAGDTLNHMHEQQRKWPGSSFAYGQDKGREFTVAAPYSPFQDPLVGGQGAAGGSRRDSGAAPPSTTLHTPTGIVSEHPMETRRSSKK